MLVTVPHGRSPSKSRRNFCSAGVSCTSLEPSAEVPGPRGDGACSTVVPHSTRQLSVDFQEIQHHRQKSFRVIDMYGAACVGNHDGLREAAAFPHFIIEEGTALGTPFAREK